jgi:YggT family protein
VNNLHNAFNDLVATILDLYLYVFLLRIVLHAVRADYYNPLSQVILKLTQPLLRPLQAMLPAWRRFDLAAGVIMLALTALDITLMAALWGQGIGPGDVALYTLVKVVVLVLNLYIFALVIQAVLSWVGPGFSNPAGNLLWVINEPLLKPVRRVIPPTSGLDFSPLIVILVLVFVRRLILLPSIF